MRSMFAARRLVKRTWRLLVQTGAACREDEVPRFAAALAYHAALAVVPLVVVVTALDTAVFGVDTVQRHIGRIVEVLFGGQTQDALLKLVSQWRESPSYKAALIVAAIALMFSASSAFTHIQQIMDGLWGVEMKESHQLSGKVKQRLLSLLGIPVVAAAVLFLLLVVAGFDAFIRIEALPGLSHAVVSFLILTAVFGLVFKVVPRAHVAWSDVWIGAAVTALFFIVGRSAILIYLGQSSVIALYGTAGPFIIILLWAYYASLVLIIGGAVTAAYAAESGKPATPTQSADAVAEPARSATPSKPRRRAAGE